jgi:hypothetical protein
VAQLKTNYFLEDPAVLAEDFRRWLRRYEGLGPRSHVNVGCRQEVGPGR